MPPVACILASVLHFRDDTLHVFRQVIGTVAYLGIGERAVIPQGLQGALADFQLQADILVVEPASRPLHAFQIQMGIPSTLCMNRSIFMANSSNAFLSKHTVSITIRADVIVPAAEIFLIIAGIVKAEYIHVPVIGLADGIIDNLYAIYLKTE